MAGFSHRISKGDLFACLSLWMEESPLASTMSVIDIKQRTDQASEDIEKQDRISRHLNKTGTVVIDQNDRIVAIDCSREGLHAIANALVAHPNKSRGGTVYMSRKPCSVCMKYLIQLEIHRVYYLPFEPEVPTEDDLRHCDKLCTACPIALSVYIPSISTTILQECSQKRSPYTVTKGCFKEYKQDLLDRHWNEDWLKRLPTLWPTILDENFLNQQICNMFEFLSQVAYVDVPQGITFHRYGSSNGIVSSETTGNELINENDSQSQKFARHMSRLAHILSQRSDDPSRGVGAVITRNHDIVAVGWNGFPSKAMYGDFPRASDIDTHAKDKKYPFSIHAEQSAILTRFTDDIGDKTTVLFVSKMPCDECTPVISKVGIKNIVFPPLRPKNHSTALQYGLFEAFSATGRFKCYVSTMSSSNMAVSTVVSNGSL